MVYYVTYISKSDNDCCTVWTEASSEDAAIRDVKSEYWDIKDIISVSTR